MSKLTLEVPDISCAHCEKTIVNALQPQQGVKSVAVNIPAKTVALDLDEQKMPLDQVRAILDEEGYPVAAVRPA
jgi:copper chaperone